MSAPAAVQEKSELATTVDTKLQEERAARERVQGDHQQLQTKQEELQDQLAQRQAQAEELRAAADSEREQRESIEQDQDRLLDVVGVVSAVVLGLFIFWMAGKVPYVFKATHPPGVRAAGGAVVALFLLGFFRPKWRSVVWLSSGGALATLIKVLADL